MLRYCSSFYSRTTFWIVFFTLTHTYCLFCRRHGVEALQNAYINTALSYAYHSILSLCYCSQGQKVPFSPNLSGRYKIPSWQTHPAPRHLQHCSIINRCTERTSRLMDDGLSGGILQAWIWQALRTHTRADSVKTEQRFKVKYAQHFWEGGEWYGERMRGERERERVRWSVLVILWQSRMCVDVCGLIWLWGSLHWRPLESGDAVCCECCCKLFHWGHIYAPGSISSMWLTKRKLVEETNILSD